MTYRFKSFLSAILLSSLALLGFASCESDEDDAQIAVDVTGIKNNAEVYAGEILQLKVFATTTSSSLSDLKISLYNKEQGSSVIDQRALAGQTFDEYIYLTVPYLTEERAELTINVAFTDNTGYTRAVERLVYVLRRDEPMEERSGVVLYCSTDMDSKPNGYCFSEMRPLICSLVDDSLIDLYIPDIAEIDLPDPTNPPTIINQWSTKTDLNFARSSNFDFSKATSLNIASAYQASIRAPKITMLRSGDIVLVGRGAEPLGVIQIVDMINAGSLSESRYILNLKVIKSAMPYEPEEQPVVPGSHDSDMEE